MRPAGPGADDAAMTVPLDPAARAAAPDLARGGALLLIAVANAHLFLYGHGGGVRGHDPGAAPVDRAVAAVQVVLVDGRAYPLFGVLVGFGLARLADRHGCDLVRRRSRWLLVLGLGHAALLFSGDVLGAYGLLGLLFAGRVADPGRPLRAALPWLAGPALTGAALAAPGPPGQSAWLVSMTVTDPLTGVVVRIGEWVAVGLLQAVGVAAAVLAGAWLARTPLLDGGAAGRPWHLAAAGFTVSVAGGVPLALMAAGAWPDPPLAARLAAGALHGVTGYAGGIAALAVAVPVGRRSGAVVTALRACGRCSLTCYLAQSVVFVAVLAPYGGGLGDRVGPAGAAALAAATWAATVAGADLLRRAGVRGPAETWLRRRTYRRTAAAGGP